MRASLRCSWGVVCERACLQARIVTCLVLHVAVGVAWGNDDLALVYESWYKTRRSVCWAVSPGAPDKGAQLMFDRNYEVSGA